MAIPYPGEVLGPPLKTFWAAHGETIIMPILAWCLTGLVVFTVGMMILAICVIIKYDIPLSPGTQWQSKPGMCGNCIRQLRERMLSARRRCHDA
jgi:hypothetical protein